MGMFCPEKEENKKPVTKKKRRTLSPQRGLGRHSGSLLWGRAQGGLGSQAKAPAVPTVIVREGRDGRDGKKSWGGADAGTEHKQGLAATNPPTASPRRQGTTAAPQVRTDQFLERAHILGARKKSLSHRVLHPSNQRPRLHLICKSLGCIQGSL